MSAAIHISLSAEPIYYLGHFPITNSMLTSALVTGLIVTFALIANRALKKTDTPTGIQNVAEFIVESFYHFCHSITGDMKKAQVFLPWIASFFIFIILNNWSGLIPGVGAIYVPVAKPTATQALPLVPSAMASSEPAGDARAPHAASNGNATAQAEAAGGATTVEGQPAHQNDTESEAATTHSGKRTSLFRAGTADLNTTLALGLISVIMVQIFGFRFQGFRFSQKYFNFSSPINFFVGILELISEFGKIISFGFRLFGNIFAGEVLIGVLLYLTKVIIPVPFYGLELFVGMMQAVVFSMLSLVLFNMATAGHGDEH